MIWRSLCSYSTCQRPLTSHAARRWTCSSLFISTLSSGALVSIAYPRCGRTITRYSGINAAFGDSVKDWWAMNSNRLAVFAASLQCFDEGKVASRGRTRSRMTVTWEFWWLVSAERRGRIPTVFSANRFLSLACKLHLSVVFHRAP